MISSMAGIASMNRLDERPDEVLVDLAVRGEAQSFATLAARYRVKAMRVAYGILHNPADAEDAVQNAFIRIHQGLSQYRGTGEFSAWLYRVVVNESIRLQRSKRNVSDELDEEYIAEDGIDREHILAVRQCLAMLPERLRTVLALRGVEELDYSEIAVILCIPVGTVRSRLHEARRIFAKCWKEMMKDEM